jgi:2-dehydro-3-deoxyphosphooctonate aldolase (KDO 8-P synthase)
MRKRGNMKRIEIKEFGIEIANDKKFVLIAGPCVLETKDEAEYIALFCKDLCRKYGIEYIFKASFDKANRSSGDSFRGVGIENGLEILKGIREKFDLPITTDVHSVSDIEKVADVVDIIQIPAFLCRQTDILISAGKTGKTVNVKKGQFLAPDDMKNVVEKIESQNNKNIILTERGSSFGYNNLVVDMKGIEKMKKTGYPVFFDATHSMQLPGGCGSFTGGEREYTISLAKSAIALGIAGIFMEVHPEPEKSPSDKTTIYPLSKLEDALIKLKDIDDLIKSKKYY